MRLLNNIIFCYAGYAASVCGMKEGKTELNLDCDFKKIQKIIQNPEYFSSFSSYREKKKVLFSFLKHICTKTDRENDESFLDLLTAPEQFQALLKAICRHSYSQQCWKEKELQEMIIWINEGPAVIDPECYVKEIFDYIEHHRANIHRNVSNNFFHPILRSSLEDVSLCSYIFEKMTEYQVKLDKRYLGRILNRYFNQIKEYIEDEKDQGMEVEWSCSKYILLLQYACNNSSF